MHYVYHMTEKPHCSTDLRHRVQDPTDCLMIQDEVTIERKTTQTPYQTVNFGARQRLLSISWLPIKLRRQPKLSRNVSLHLQDEDSISVL